MGRSEIHTIDKLARKQQNREINKSIMKLSNPLGSKQTVAFETKK